MKHLCAGREDKFQSFRVSHPSKTRRVILHLAKNIVTKLNNLVQKYTFTKISRQIGQICISSSYYYLPN